MKSTLLQITAITLMAFGNNVANAQCVINPSSIYTFTYNGATYEVVKENKTWAEAADCAVIRGGILAEINDQAEQDAIYTELNTNSGISVANTVAPDGGNASYVWIGGNDIGTEGEWIWDGGNAGSGAQFWQGTSTGSPIGGLYNNWGNEPDDWNGQDALGLAVTDWPLGVSGQWNDVDDGNSLYFVIEMPNTTGLVICYDWTEFAIYPNPAQNELHVMNETNGADFREFTIYDAAGKHIRTIDFQDEFVTSIDVSELEQGVYFLHILHVDGTIITEQFVK